MPFLGFSGILWNLRYLKKKKKKQALIILWYRKKHPQFWF